MLLWSNLRVGNFIIMDTLLDLVNQGLTYTDLLFVCQAQTLIYQRGMRGVGGKNGCGQTRDSICNHNQR